MPEPAEPPTPALPDGLSASLLGPTDLARVHALHLAACAGMDAKVVRPETIEFFARQLSGGADVIGLETEDGELVAYAVLQIDLAGEEEFLPLLGLTDAATCVKLAGTSVAPSWRGRGLQAHLSRLRLERAAARGAAHAFATASQHNPASYLSLLRSGLTGARFARVYGGVWRLVLHADVTNPYQPDVARTILVDAADSDALALSVGLDNRVYAQKKAGDGNVLAIAPPLGGLPG